MFYVKIGVMYHFGDKDWDNGLHGWRLNTTGATQFTKEEAEKLIKRIPVPAHMEPVSN